METQNEWWYEINREQNGPVSEQEIRDLYLTGMLNKDNLVWKDGLENWVPLHTTEFVKTNRAFATSNIPAKDEQLKWYNNSKKLTLSMLFWPAFIYGMYKTNLVKKKSKQIGFGVLAFIGIVAAWSDETKPKIICGHYQSPKKDGDGYWPGADIYIGSFLDEKCSDEGSIRQVNTFMGRTEERTGSYRYDKESKTLYISFRDGQGPTSVHITNSGMLEWGDGFVQTNAFQ